MDSSNPNMPKSIARLNTPAGLRPVPMTLDTGAEADKEAARLDKKNIGKPPEKILWPE